MNKVYLFLLIFSLIGLASAAIEIGENGSGRTINLVSTVISTTDTNASTACSGDEVLLGNASCATSSAFGGAGGNSTFNQTLTDTLYSRIEWDYNQTDTIYFYNQTVLDTDTNLSTGGTISGDLNVTGNITENDALCFNPDCSSYIYWNGTGLVIQG